MRYLCLDMYGYVLTFMSNRGTWHVSPTLVQSTTPYKMVMWSLSRTGVSPQGTPFSSHTHISVHLSLSLTLFTPLFVYTYEVYVSLLPIYLCKCTSFSVLYPLHINQMSIV